MRYIGGKSLLLEEIHNVIKENCDNVSSIIDIFAGSGVVSQYFKAENYSVISNDFLYFSYVLGRGTLPLNKKPKFLALKEKLGIKDPIKYLNNTENYSDAFSKEECFIYNNFSPNENCNRMYFQPENALKIDKIRLTLNDWRNLELLTEDEYFYLLAALVAAVPYVSNIAGGYGAYLKHWDVRTYNELTLKAPELISSRKRCRVYNRDCNELLKEVKADILYADPPYNARQYLPNYHVLETIAEYDYPVLTGVTGMRPYSHQKSDFCKRSKVAEAFRALIENANVRYVVISYNNEGLLSKDELSALCKEYAAKDTFKLYEVDYRRYKSKIPNNKEGLQELIFFFEKA